MTGTITGYEVIENRNSDQKVLMLQVELSGPEDIQSVEWYNSGGVQSIPIVGSKVQILQNGRGWKVAVSANDGIDFDSTLAEGDKKIYGGEVDSYIILRADGTIEINGDSKNFVTHAELDTALQTMLTSINAELLTIQVGATAAIAASGLWTTPLVLGNSTLDISSSETTTVKTGG